MVCGCFVGLSVAVGFGVDDGVDWCGEFVVEGVFDLVGYVMAVGDRDRRIDCDGSSDSELMAVPSGSEFG